VLIDTVLAHGAERYRDFPWRNTTDPYAVLVSEVMLQQTQTSRVRRYFEAWIRRFPTIDALAAAATSDVLAAWQGLGYNRRALALHTAATIVSECFGGVLPDTTDELRNLPGIGPATAAGILAFAHNRPAAYLETNVRAVLLHEVFPDRDGVPDRELFSLLVQLSERVHARQIGARQWNYALLDYGAHLKATLPVNPSRRSKHHSRQSPYEGSRRQKRARLLEAVLAESGQTTADLARACGFDLAIVEDVLGDLQREGFIHTENNRWFS
jgi:A/G-specific adenine glycosylase